MIVWTKNILQALEEAGWPQAELVRQRLLRGTVLQELRENRVPQNPRIIGRICALLHCQPGDLLQYIPDDDTKAIAAANAQRGPRGGSPKRIAVVQWRKQHPEGRKADCHRDTGISWSEVARYWDDTLKST